MAWLWIIPTKSLTTLETEIKQTAKNLLSPDCYWEFDLYSGALNWSAALCSILGFNQNDAPGFEQLITLFLPGKNIRLVFNRAIHQGIPFELELSSIAKNEILKPVFTLAEPVYDDYGRCIKICGKMESKQTLFTGAGNPFSSAENEVQQVMLDNFAWIISHNLRAHTSNLQMVVENIQQNTPPDEILTMMEHLKSISKKLNQTVGYLNTLVKI